MKDTIFFKITLCAGAMVFLGACASTTATQQDVTYEEPKNQREVALLTANELTATKNVTKSADGEMTCKRQEIAGSRFKRKICMTDAEWEKLSADNRASTRKLHRKASQQTVRN